MKSKATLFLMEQLVMLLVFALAAVLCMSVFVRSDRISEEIKQRDEAVILASNAAEMLKAAKNPQEVLKAIEKDGFTLEIQEEESGIAGLKQAKIIVFCDQDEVFSLQTGWQEVEP
jgi:Tfp pilus assembly protein PilV